MFKQPTLYILMRDDLESLNPGKAIAQGSHATNDFEWMVNEEQENDELQEASDLWRDDRTFGLCYTVAAKPHQIEQIEDLVSNSSFIGGSIIDPTYPVRDGETTHYIPLLTCGWVFVWDKDKYDYNDKSVYRAIKQLTLYP